MEEPAFPPSNKIYAWDHPEMRKWLRFTLPRDFSHFYRVIPVPVYHQHAAFRAAARVTLTQSAWNIGTHMEALEQKFISALSATSHHVAPVIGRDLLQELEEGYGWVSSAPVSQWFHGLDPLAFTAWGYCLSRIPHKVEAVGCYIVLPYLVCSVPFSLFDMTG